VTRTFNCTLLVLPRYCSVFSAFRFVQYGGGVSKTLSSVGGAGADKLLRVDQVFS